MKDTSTLSYKGDWRGLLDFLKGSLSQTLVSRVNIKEENENDWSIKIQTSDEGKQRKSSSLAGLFDLGW